MNKIFSYLLIILGTISGFFLLVFGMAKILNNKKRSGIFFTTIFIFLSLFGCKTGNAVSNNGIIKRMKNIDELVKTDEWKKFREIWKTIDSYGDFDFLGSTISADEINNAIDSVEKTGILFPVEIEILRNISIARIEGINNNARLMVMHTIPQISDRQYFLSNLEYKIDVLNKLKKDEIVDKEEFEKAVLIIKKQIEMFSIMDIIAKYYNEDKFNFGFGEYYGQPYSDEKSLKIYEDKLNKFENEYNEFMKNKNNDELSKDLENKYNETKSKIEEVRKSMKVIYELIDNLENE